MLASPYPLLAFVPLGCQTAFYQQGYQGHGLPSPQPQRLVVDKNALCHRIHRWPYTQIGDAGQLHKRYLDDNVYSLAHRLCVRHKRICFHLLMACKGSGDKGSDSSTAVGLHECDHLQKTCNLSWCEDPTALLCCPSRLCRRDPSTR